MSSFIMKQMIGGKMNDMKGSLGGGDKKEEGGGDKAEEDPEVIQARLEQEERRKEKHRRQEMEREKMRNGVREKYNIKKKEDLQAEFMLDDSLMGGSRKADAADEGVMGQAGAAANKAKEALGGFGETIKGFLPFGK